MLDRGITTHYLMPNSWPRRNRLYSLDAGCYALLMISMGTIEELRHQDHTLALYCLSCDRWGEANLEWLIQNGKGNRPVTEARFRCKDCGEIVEKQVRPPVPEIGRTLAHA